MKKDVSIVGAGLDKYAYINSDLVPHYLKHKIISAHNGYLAILTQYGLIIGSYIFEKTHINYKPKNFNFIRKHCNGVASRIKCKNFKD